MSAPRCTEFDYIDYLVASPLAATCTEAARVQPGRPDAPAHDAFTRLLTRLEPDPGALWDEARPLVRPGGVLVLDDSTLDKPHAKHIDLVGFHRSGKHRRAVLGIDLISLVWADGDRVIPCDYRLYDKADGRTKDDHFLAMIATAASRGLAPRCALFDMQYASLENLKAVRDLGWTWLTKLKADRMVNPDCTGLLRLDEVPVSASGTVVHPKGYGLVRVFAIVARDGDIELWATNDVAMDELPRLAFAERCWAIEDYHRGLKQHCNAEQSQARSARAQRNHVGLAIRALLRLEWHRYSTGVSWAEAKARIIRDAIRKYVSRPLYVLPGTA